MTLLPATHIAETTAVYVASVNQTDLTTRGNRNQMTFAIRLPEHTPFVRPSMAVQVLAPELCAVSLIALVQGSNQWQMQLPDDKSTRSPLLLVRIPPAASHSRAEDRTAGNVEEFDDKLFVILVGIQPLWNAPEDAARAHYTLSVRVSDQLTDDSAGSIRDSHANEQHKNKIVVWVTAPYSWAAVVMMSLVVMGIASLTCVIRLWCEQREIKRRHLALSQL